MDLSHGTNQYFSGCFFIALFPMLLAQHEGDPDLYGLQFNQLEALYNQSTGTDNRYINGSVGFFILVAILIAALGLFGLSAHTTLLRTKEIRIRKVNGDSSQRILVMS